MNENADLFVQAFWVKCREVIRPEIDARIGNLRRAGYSANVSTQEFSETADRLPAPVGPSLKLSIGAVDETADVAHRAIEFQGDVLREAVDVLTDGARSHSYELAALGTIEVKAEIDRWLAGSAAAAPA